MKNPTPAMIKAVSRWEADAARTEIERRLLTAADKDSPEARHGDAASWHRFLTPALCLVIPLFALGLYLRLGQPGLPAAPFVASAQVPAVDEAAQRRERAAAIPALARPKPAPHWWNAWRNWGQNSSFTLPAGEVSRLRTNSFNSARCGTYAPG